MPPTRSAAVLDKDPSVVKKTFRGVEYTFTEITIAEYDEIVERVTSENPDTGAKIVDSTLQLKEMVRAMVSPRPGRNLPPRVIFAINKVVNDMTYAEEPESGPPSDDEEEAGKA